MNAHAAGAIVEKAARAASASALTPAGSLGRPGTCTSDAVIDVVDAAMHVAFEKPTTLLPRRVVAEGDVDVGVDQAGDRGGAVGVDHDVGR